MQDQYVGDIGDFGKYSLLRALCGTPEEPVRRLPLGVIWYRHPDERDRNDGRHTTYRNLPHTSNGLLRRNWLRLRPCDPALYDTLRRIVGNRRRKVSVIENTQNEIFPEGSIFYESQISLISVNDRRAWFKEAVHKVKDESKIVFFDPDNGITHRDAPSPKHVAFSELETLWNIGKSLVIYHHLNRQRGYFHHAQIDDLSSEIMTRFHPTSLWALHYHRGTARVFFVLAQTNHCVTIAQRMQKFLQNQFWFTPQLGFRNLAHFSLVV